MAGRLSAYVGLTVSYVLAGFHQDAALGTFDLYLANAAILHANGSITPILTGQAGLSIAGFAGTQCGASQMSSGSPVVATTDAAINTTFYLDDHLGTTQMELSGGGWPVWEGTFSPLGAELADGSTLMRYKFTGKERDTESGLDYFGARYYASNMGRFMSPDWAAKAEPVPYAKLDNPQSLNLYSYVLNNPLRLVDPDGHADIAAECKGQSTCNKTLVQTVNIVHQQTDKATGQSRTVVDSTLKITTNFTVTTDAKGNMSASASSTVENVSGHAYSASQLSTMGGNIGAMQQAAVTMGFGANTTQLVTGIGAAETRFGSDANGTSHAWMNPAINPMQLTQGSGATLDRQHNIYGAMGVLDWAGSSVDFDPTKTYYRYSGRTPAAMANWTGTYSSIQEHQP